jgi:hypothetical protein
VRRAPIAARRTPQREGINTMSSGILAPPRQPLRLPPLAGRFAGLRRDWFIYGTSVTYTGTGQTKTATINIDGTAPFELHSVQFATADTAAIPALIKWSDNTNSLGLMSDFSVPVNTVAGTGQEPHYLVVPYVFDANAVVNFVITNNGGATQTLFITFSGAKLKP